MAKRGGKRGGRRVGGLSALSFADLRREVVRRERRLPALMRRRHRILTKLAAVEEMIADLGADVGRAVVRAAGGGKRHRNEMSLADALAKALKGKTMTVGEA